MPTSKPCPVCGSWMEAVAKVAHSLAVPRLIKADNEWWWRCPECGHAEGGEDGQEEGQKAMGDGTTDRDFYAEDDEAPSIRVVHFTSVAHCPRCGAVCALCAQTDERRGQGDADA